MDSTTMETEVEQTRKRKLTDDECENAANKKHIGDEQYRSKEFNLVDFSDEMLLAIMQKLDSTSLIKLARTCIRLRTLAQDRTHWVNVDLSDEPLGCKNIYKLLFKDVCRFEEIKTLKIRGQTSLYPIEKWKNETLTPHFLLGLSSKCPKLEYLFIQEAYIDAAKISVIDLPRQLKGLSLDSCQLAGTGNPRTSFFSKIYQCFKDLEKLEVENCNWFDTHDLIAFSKLVNLKVLSLRGCSTFKDCVPYGSIATRFGFRSLEVLDVRDTPVTDSDIQCFNMTKSLKELRLQCPSPTDKKCPIREDLSVSEGDGPGTSGESSNLNEFHLPEPDDLPGPVGPVINLHIRQRRRHEDDEQPDHLNEREQNQLNIADEDRVLEAGAEFHAGNNNVRINIRNQNVQGRNVIHIVLRNNHTCNRNNNNNNNNAENPDEDGNDQENQENPQVAQENPNPENPGDPPAAADNENNENPAQNNDDNNVGGGAQHYIMIRGFRDPGQADQVGEELNPARIVQPELIARLAHSNPYQFYNRFIQFQRTYPLNPTSPMHLITDRGICSFGQSMNNAAGGLIWIRTEQRSPTTPLESITVRNYKLVTNTTLQHLSSCAPHLKYLDVIGTEVTKDGIERFKLQKPECRVLSSFGVFPSIL